MDGVRELLALCRISGLPHAVRHRAMRDDLGIGEELVSRDVVDVLVGERDVSGHGRPDVAEQLNHLPCVRQVRLRVDHHPLAQVDQAGVGVAHQVRLVQYGETVVAHLLHLHRTGLP
jgi:hypothetical protein